MRNVASSVAALGALSLAYACTSSIEVGYDGPGGGSAGTTGASTSTGTGRGATTVSSGGGAGTTATSTASTSGGGAGTTTTTTASTGGGGAGTTTATTSTASTGAGGGEVGPCTPAPLVGINLTDTGWQTARLDPLTGDLTVLAVNGAGSFVQGFSAYDPGTKHLYEFGNSGVYTIDGTTGAVLGFAGIDANDIYNPQVNAAGEIIVIHLLPGGTDETARLDPTTGALTSLLPLSISSYGQAEGTVDAKADRIYQFGAGYVLTLDGATGATLATASIPEFDNAIVNYAGELIGIDYPAHTLGRLDPTTGAITTLAPFSAGTEQGIRTYDPCSNRIYQFAGYSLYTLDGTTGALISTVTMPQQNFTNVEAIW